MSGGSRIKPVMTLLCKLIPDIDNRIKNDEVRDSAAPRHFHQPMTGRLFFLF